MSEADKLLEESRKFVGGLKRQGDQGAEQFAASHLRQLEQSRLIGSFVKDRPKDVIQVHEATITIDQRGSDQ